MSKIQLIVALAALFVVGGSITPTLAQFAVPLLPGPGSGPGLGAGPGAGPRPFYHPGHPGMGHGDMPRFAKSPGRVGRADLPRDEKARSALGRGNSAQRGDWTRGDRVYNEKAGRDYSRSHGRDYRGKDSRYSRHHGRHYGRDRHRNKYYIYGIYGYADGGYSTDYNDENYYSSNTGSHVRWCTYRYRSYDASIDTYIGSDGYRHRCRSPY
jgi:hypothetical protein